MSQTKVKDLSDIFSTIPQYVFEIGIFSEHTKRKEKIQIGLTNAELMFIHEYGSPLRNIPARPVLHMTLDWAKTQLPSVMSKAVAEFIKSGENAYKKELDKFALRIEKYARRIIYDNDGRLEANAASTIAAKGDNHPLFNTGQLARSITCIVRKLN